QVPRPLRRRPFQGPRQAGAGAVLARRAATGRQGAGGLLHGWLTRGSRAGLPNAWEQAEMHLLGVLTVPWQLGVEGPVLVEHAREQQEKPDCPHQIRRPRTERHTAPDEDERAGGGSVGIEDAPRLLFGQLAAGLDRCILRQGSMTVEPVVLRSARSRWTCCASRNA